MKGLVSATISTQAPEAKPTIENLVKHVRTFGLSSRNGNGKETRYTAYSKFRNDAAVEVARAYLGEDAFVQFVGLIGYSEFQDNARADWAKVREEK